MGRHLVQEALQRFISVGEHSSPHLHILNGSHCGLGQTALRGHFLPLGEISRNASLGRQMAFLKQRYKVFAIKRIIIQAQPFWGDPPHFRKKIFGAPKILGQGDLYLHRFG